MSCIFKYLLIIPYHLAPTRKVYLNVHYIVEVFVYVPINTENTVNLSGITRKEHKAISLTKEEMWYSQRFCNKFGESTRQGTPRTKTLDFAGASVGHLLIKPNRIVNGMEEVINPDTDISNNEQTAKFLEELICLYQQLIIL